MRNRSGFEEKKLVIKKQTGYEETNSEKQTGTNMNIKIVVAGIFT